MNPEEHLPVLAYIWMKLDPATAPGTSAHVIWGMINLFGSALFYGRFYTQWIVSEIRGKSVVPTAFWYMSSVGSLALLAHAAHISSPVQSLSQCINIVIYARNLVHIWRERGKLSKSADVAVHAFVGVVAVVGLGIVAYTWLHEIQKEQSNARTWFWIALGVAGTALFACRFIVQWLATEAKKKSVVPLSFWYISVVAAFMLSASFFHDDEEWVYGIGVASNIPVYLRNIWLIKRGGASASVSGA